jgi:branched-subunit amino acid ABC-type transport system permease component
VAAGMVLFIVSVGLSVTMGLMGFVNLIAAKITHWMNRRPPRTWASDFH